MTSSKPFPLLLTFILLYSSVYSYSIECTPSNPCSSPINCIPNENCTVTCSSNNACRDAIINCTDDTVCNIICSKSTACRGISIIGNSALSLYASMEVSDTASASFTRDSSIICPTNGSCIINCEEYDSCNGLILNGSVARYLSMSSMDYQPMTIYCPTIYPSDYNVINCQLFGDKDNAWNEFNIYNIYGMVGLNMSCLLSIGNPCMTDYSATLHCNDGYTDSCMITNVDYSCNGSNTNVCERWTFTPTNDPTVYPTLEPTLQPVVSTAMPTIFFISDSPTFVPSLDPMQSLLFL